MIKVARFTEPVNHLSAFRVRRLPLHETLQVRIYILRGSSERILRQLNNLSHLFIDIQMSESQTGTPSG